MKNCCRIDIADASNGYFVESFTIEEVTNRIEGILNTRKEGQDELHKLKT